MIVKTGDGTLALAASNTFSQPLHILAGTVSGTTRANFGAGTIAIGAGTTLSLNASAGQTFSGVITGTGTFAKAGTGVVTISGVNTFSGQYTVTGTGDTVFQGNLGAAQGKPRLNLNSGKILLAQVYVGQDLTFSELVSTGTSSVNAAFESATGTRTLHAEQATNTTFNAVMSDASGSRLLGFKKSGAGTLTLSGANTYTGATTINGGTLVSGHATALGTGAVAVNTGGTLTFTVNATGTRTVTANSGSVINKGGFAHTGTTFVNNGGTINN
jgi:autotransporter-associated beta strand protein